MNEVSNEPLTGAAWATHHVAVWLENDRPLSEGARLIADKPDAVARFAEVILYGDTLTAGRTAPGHDRQAARNVRESFTREDFDGIDWAAVRESLLAE